MCTLFYLPIISPGTSRSWIPCLEHKITCQMFYQLSYHHLPSLSMCTLFSLSIIFYWSLKLLLLNPWFKDHESNVLPNVLPPLGKFVNVYPFSLYPLSLLEIAAPEFHPLNLEPRVKCSTNCLTNCPTTSCQVCKCVPFLSSHYFLLELSAPEFHPLNLGAWFKCSTNCPTSTCQVCKCVPFCLFPLFSTRAWSFYS